MRNKNYSITVGWLYPELMSTYGDRGNIIVLQKRCEWRNINIQVKRINQNSKTEELDNCDILFMGGAQDIQQEIVNKDLIKTKGKKIMEMIEQYVPGLFICGAYQFMGKYYIDGYGNEIKGLGIFDMYTEASQNSPRLIGNIVIKPNKLTENKNSSNINDFLVGFENHGGRTYLNDPTQSFGTVVKGLGNNGNDSTEGIQYKNSIGTYLHGPILPSNPKFADYLIEGAIAKKYLEDIKLSKIDDDISEKAKLIMLKRLKTAY